MNESASTSTSLPNGSYKRGKCEKCGCAFALKQNGNVRSHRSGGAICSGAGKPPAPDPQLLEDNNSVFSLFNHQNSSQTEQAEPKIHQNSTFSAASKIRFDDAQREELLGAQISTCIILDYAKRCSKAIRSAMAAAAFDDNYDPLLALKVVLAAAPPRRRGEVRKKLLDAFFASDVNFLITHIATQKPTSVKTRIGDQRRLNAQGADASAMLALSAGMPGRALRRLTQNGTLPATNDTIEALRSLHPQSPIPQPTTISANRPPFQVRFIGPALKAMKHQLQGHQG